MPYKYSSRKSWLSRALEWLGFIALLPLNFFTGKREARGHPVNILIVEPFQMGDVISTTVLLDPLKRKFPASRLYVLTKPRNAEVLSGDPRIEQVLVADFPWSDYGSKKGTGKRWLNMLKALWAFRKYRFDIGLDCRGDVRSQLLMALLGCKRRLGYTNYLHSNITLRGLLLTEKLASAPYTHRYDWNLHLLTLLDFSKDELFPIRFPTLRMPCLATGSGGSAGIVLHIGGGWVYKRWPNDRWAELIGRLSGQYAEPITVVGGPGEKDLVDEVRRMLPAHIPVVFKITSFEELIRLIHGCRLFIGLDSGPMNIANALDKRAVALFGPGDSDVWRPYRQDSVFLHKKESFPCNPCAQKQCFFPQKNCMASIEVAEVAKVVDALSQVR